MRASRSSRRRVWGFRQWHHSPDAILFKRKVHMPFSELPIAPIVRFALGMHDCVDDDTPRLFRVQDCKWETTHKTPPHIVTDFRPEIRVILYQSYSRFDFRTESHAQPRLGLVVVVNCRKKLLASFWMHRTLHTIARAYASDRTSAVEIGRTEPDSISPRRLSAT